MKPKTLTHIDARGQTRMVDVGQKRETHRVAIAHAKFVAAKATLALLRSGKTKKSDVLPTARVAGISAAKATATLIPMCHPVALTHVRVDITVQAAHIDVMARAECYGKTGVEMEALTAASVACLTLYDMLKAHDRAMSYYVELISKSGGRSDLAQASSVAKAKRA
jgi:cyclic pyranopterin monophosphate synthase